MTACVASPPALVRGREYDVRLGRSSADKDAAIALWQRNLAPADRVRRYGWAYEGNPAGSGRVWLAADENGCAIGAAGLIPRQTSVGGGAGLAGEAADFVVDSDARGLGPAVALQRCLTQECRPASFVYGFPNRKAETVQRRVGFEALGTMHRWVKVLRLEAALRAHPAFSRAARLVAPALDAALGVTAPERRRPRTSGVTVKHVAACDARFDRLWARAAKSIPILGDRSSRFLDWRYRQAPDAAYDLCAAIRESDGEMVGYVAYRVVGGVCRIVDLLANDMAAALDTTLHEFILQMRAASVATISLCYLGIAEVTGALSRWGFRRRADSQNVLLWIPADIPAEKRALLRAADNWHLLEGDDV